MSITKEERTLAALLRSPQIPIAAVEGTFKGERRVILCIAQPKKGDPNTIERIPIAMLLDQKDFPEISLDPGKQPSKIILSPE